jgi:hypothetical protein
MIPYLILMAIPAIFSLVSTDKKKFAAKELLFFIGIIYIVFTGFRHEVSLDWQQYFRMYDSIKSSSSLEDALSITEPGFVVLNWIMAGMDTDVYGVNVVVAIIFISGLFRFADRMPRPWLALLSVTPYLVIVISMSAVRQTAAIGLIFHLLASWNQGIIKRFLLALIATSFHYSAFVSIVFVLLSMKMPVWLKWLVVLAGSALSVYIFTRTDQYAHYETAYTGAEGVESFGALQHVALNAIPAAIYLFFIKKWNALYGKNQLIFILSVLSLLSVPGVAISSTGIDRLALYLSPIQMLIYSTLPSVFKNQNYAIVIVIIHIVILYIWLSYANSAYAFLPYKNIIFN